MGDVVNSNQAFCRLERLCSGASGAEMDKRILEIGNWPPPVCGWSMGLVGLRKELESRGWDCQVMNLNENRRVRSPYYIDVQSGWDYVSKVARLVWRGYAVHVRVNGETKKGFLLALAALLLARLARRPALLTYAGGHRQSYFPAPKGSLRYLAFSLLFRIPQRIYCNSPAVKSVLLTTCIPAERVEPIPHFSSNYVKFTPTALPAEVVEFCRSHEGVFFSYVCFRKEFALDLLAEAMRRFHKAFPKVGFLLVGIPEREKDFIRKFLREKKVEDAVCVLGSVPHDTFLTLLTESLAYIRTPLTDGICSSVLESLNLKVPVLAADNGTRPPGTRLWREGDLKSLLTLMTEVVENHAAMVAEIPDIVVEDNAKKLADSIEQVSLKTGLAGDPREVGVGN
jgi:glycosyltransferase involved in cell wall biosynthesis